MLFEIATIGPGFAVDEDEAHLGEGLSLPPKFEPLREQLRTRSRRSLPPGVAPGRPHLSVLRLVTIPISHYCEKARWALDRAGLPYREERHVQGIHMLAARRAGGGRTAPVLVTPAGVDRRVGPDPRMGGPAHRSLRAAGRRTRPIPRREVRALCARFDELLGPSGRRLVYVHMFGGERELMLRFNDQGVPAWEDRLLRARAAAVQAPHLSRAGDPPRASSEADETVVWQELDRVAELLSDGRPYLSGSASRPPT